MFMSFENHGICASVNYMCIVHKNVCTKMNGMRMHFLATRGLATKSGVLASW